MEHHEAPDIKEEGETLPPFTQEFVLSVTKTRVMRAIKYAKRKTKRRLRDFPEGSGKYNEVMDTLDIIDEWGRSINSFLSSELKRINGKTG